jgi:oxygen-independent coproporphyrinogen-3 oxidase
MNPVAIYVHIPFCPSKCGYCDFNSYAMEGDIISRTVAAIRTEIERSPWRGRPAKTIFFGGGTPTFLSSEALCSILQSVLEVHPPVEGCEITSEANPGTIDFPKFATMREAGFNRLSLGAQSFHSDDLIRLGRVHSAGDVGRAVSTARKAGFKNINVDLIFALQAQSLARWKSNLELVAQLQTEHLSLYCLTIEPNTKYYKHWLRGAFALPDDESQVEMYNIACEFMCKSGFEHYEISNFARPGFECQHNLCYWNCEEYVSYGPGAVGRVENERYTNIKHPERYCTALETSEPAWFERESLDPEAERIERLMMGLRLSSGIIAEPGLVAQNKVDSLVDRGWLIADERLRLTAAGRHFCNQVIVELM